MYEDLINKLRELPHLLFVQLGKHEDVVYQAADAIEELSRDLDSMNDANIALYGALPKWIPVTERLPVNTKPVLIVHRGGVSTGWHNGRYWERGASTNHRPIQTVTHWMPFPQPPKEET